MYPRKNNFYTGHFISTKHPKFCSLQEKSKPKNVGRKKKIKLAEKINLFNRKSTH